MQRCKPRNLDILFSTSFVTAPVTKSSDSTVSDFEPALTPADKDACKKDGWKTFNTPVFKNQGQCVSFVNHQ